MKYTTKAPHWSYTRVVPVLLLAGLCSVAYGTESPITELAPISVSAHSGTAIPYDQSGVSVTVLDASELRKKGRFSLSEALTEVPGVAIVPGGGLDGKGNVSNIVIRGMGRQTYVLPMIDGMLACNSSGNALIVPNLLGRSNTFDLGRVEMLRGGQSAIYGGGAISGVLYTETPRGEGEPGISIFQEAGSHASYTANATAQGQHDKLHYFISSTYDHTDNDIRSADGSTPADSKAGRYECYAQALRLDYDLNESTTLTTTYRREDAWYDYAANYSGWSITPYRFRSNLVTARLESEISKRFSTSFMAGYYGLDNMLGHGNNYDLRNVQLEWRHSLRWCRHHSTILGLRWTRSQFDSTSAYDPEQGTRNINRSLENMYSLALEHIYRPLPGWTNSLAARLDYSSIYHALPTLRAASSYSFNDDSTRVFGSVGRGYRGPNAFERSRGVQKGWGSLYHGNPDLECETSWSTDIGVEQAIGENHAISITAFWIQVKDYVTTTPSGYAPEYYFINSPHWTSQGIELALSGNFGDSWDSGYNLSFTYTQPKQSNDKGIPNSSRQVWSADIHTSPADGLTTGFCLSAAVGRSDYDGSPMDSFYTLRWYARYELNKHLTLHARIENLTDQKYVTDGSNGDILAPGTSIHGGCTLTF